MCNALHICDGFCTYTQIAWTPAKINDLLRNLFAYRELFITSSANCEVHFIGSNIKTVYLFLTLNTKQWISYEKHYIIGNNQENTPSR